MPRFVYESLTRSGVLVKSEGRFESLQDLFLQLDGKGETLVNYRQRILPSVSFGRKQLKRPVLSEFFRNLALLIKGGVPLREAIDDMTSPPCNKVLMETFQGVGRRIDDGLMFSEAVQDSTTLIPRIMMPLIAIGEETGNLDRTLTDGADHLDRIENIMSSTRRALTYPTVVLIAMFGALAFWMLFVLPQLLELFNSMGIVELPLATRILIAMTEATATWWPVLPALALLFFLFYGLTKRNDKAHYVWDVFWSRMPLIRSVIKCSQLAFFFEYTSMLTSAGINILRSMELMEQSVSNQILKKGIALIRKEISEGNPMSEAIASFGYFEPFIMRMVRVGEQTGNMSEQFNFLAQHYMDRVDKLVSAMSKTIEPIIIGVAGFIFAIIALGLLGPVYNMISKIV